MDEIDEIKKTLKFTMNFSEKVTGEYIFQAVWIERILKDIISYHVSNSPKSRAFLFSIVLKEISFNSKIRIFLELLNEIPEITKNHPNLKKRLDNVREFRNILAHDQLDTSVKFLKTNPNYIRFRHFKNGKVKHYEITDKLYKEKIKEIAELHIELQNIARKISNNEIGNQTPIGTLD